MGNNLTFQSLPKKQTRGSLVAKGETQSGPFMPTENVNSDTDKASILIRRKLQNREFYYLAPVLTQSVKPAVLQAKRQQKPKDEEIEDCVCDVKNKGSCYWVEPGSNPEKGLLGSGNDVSLNAARNGSLLYPPFQSCKTIDWQDCCIYEYMVFIDFLIRCRGVCMLESFKSSSWRRIKEK